MLRNVLDMFASVLVLVAFILSRRVWFCAADLCNWSGSGFPVGGDARMVLQVRLRCTEGSVRWLYPGQALRVVLEPNLFSSARRNMLCIKASPSFGGASLFIDRGGELEPLVTDGGRAQHVSCIGAEGTHVPAIYIQTSRPGGESWSPRRMGFRYELMANRSATPGPDHMSEFPPFICVAVKVHRQRSGVFELEATTPGSARDVPLWRGVILAHLQCGVKPGEGEFLFTGSEHFGDGWLGCAPRYKYFVSVYRTAKARLVNPCDFPL
ncbi:meteorin-like protein [Hippocampus comes]|uniref:meteorin-like protein n=1 Tax=Hippocampus comes TaxID=109280 RepID=UPI00094E3D57|nr:PREDICTED: meteorin-like protein [Hippocampus comes]